MIKRWIDWYLPFPFQLVVTMILLGLTAIRSRWSVTGPSTSSTGVASATSTRTSPSTAPPMNCHLVIILCSLGLWNLKIASQINESQKLNRKMNGFAKKPHRYFWNLNLKNHNLWNLNTFEWFLNVILINQCLFTLFVYFYKV